MNIQPLNNEWRKAAHADPNANSVMARLSDDGKLVYVRSRLDMSNVTAVPLSEWQAFCKGIRDGEFEVQVEQ